MTRSWKYWSRLKCCSQKEQMKQPASRPANVMLRTCGGQSCTFPQTAPPISDDASSRSHRRERGEKPSQNSATWREQNNQHDTQIALPTTLGGMGLKTLAWLVNTAQGPIKLFLLYATSHSTHISLMLTWSLHRLHVTLTSHSSRPQSCQSIQHLCRHQAGTILNPKMRPEDRQNC